MDFKQIEAFVNVVRYKSFSKAADATFFTQPTISTHISNLEKELGAKLLDRRSRTVEMTPQGSKFYKYAVEMINARSLAFDALNPDRDAVEGILELQTSSIPGITFLPSVLSEFRQAHPSVQYYISMSDTQTVIDNILERRGEIGFIGESYTGNSLESVKLFSDRTVLAAPRSLVIPPRITLKDAVSYPFIWRETGSATRKSFENAAAEAGFSKEDFEVSALFDDVDSVLRAVEAELGVAIISEEVALKSGKDIRIVEIGDFEMQRDFYMISLRNSSLSPAAEAFAGFVKSKL